jgi:hypothetical protein
MLDELRKARSPLRFAAATAFCRGWKNTRPASWEALRRKADSASLAALACGNDNLGSCNQAERVIVVEDETQGPFVYDNFGRIHKSLRITPAMAAGLSNHVGSLEEIAALAN